MEADTTFCQTFEEKVQCSGKAEVCGVSVSNQTLFFIKEC